MTQEMVDTIQKLVEPGDALLSYEAQRFTSMFIKGNFDHAAIVTDTGTIMEAVGDYFVDGVNHGGVREVPLEEWLFKKDHVAIIRPWYSKDLRFQAGLASRKFKGKPYDYAFEYRNDAIYCSELVYKCYRVIHPNFLNKVKGEILPIDYLKFTESDPGNFKLIFNTRKELK